MNWNMKKAAPPGGSDQSQVSPDSREESKMKSITTTGRRRGERLILPALMMLMFVSSIFLAGCAGDGDGSDPIAQGGAAPETATVIVSAGGSGNFNALTSFTNESVLSMDVRVVLDTEDPDVVTPQGSVELTRTPALPNPCPCTWTGTIAGLPITPTVLDFYARAYDGVILISNLVFQGSNQDVLLLGDGVATVNIGLAPEDDGTAHAIPSITGISAVPSPILISDPVVITLDLAGLASEILVVAFDPAGVPPGGNPITEQNPGEFNVLMVSGVGSQAYDYIAPGAAAAFTHRVNVSNSQGNSTEAGLIIDVGSFDGMSVNFAPTIVPGSIVIDRTLEDTASVSVTVNDDGPVASLTYNWSYSGAGSFTNDGGIGGAGNPGLMAGLTDTGPLTVTGASWLAAPDEATLTVGTHGYLVGDTMTVSGMDPVAYDATRATITAVTPTTVSYAVTPNPLAFVSGGEVRNEGTLTLDVEDAGFDGDPLTPGDNLHTIITIPVMIPMLGGI